MEFESDSETGNSENVNDYSRLGEREENAVRIATRGLAKWFSEDEKPPPMKVVITQENPFDFRSFVAVLREDGIDVMGSLKEVSDGVLVFQPNLCDSETEESILGETIVIPEGLEKYFK
ncbi:MAG: hypothetical protein AAB521_00290 [Patescibacteria group bacterium]